MLLCSLDKRAFIVKIKPIFLLPWFLWTVCACNLKSKHALPQSFNYNGKTSQDCSGKCHPTRQEFSMSLLWEVNNGEHLPVKMSTTLRQRRRWYFCLSSKEEKNSWWKKQLLWRSLQNKCIKQRPASPYFLSKFSFLCSYCTLTLHTFKAFAALLGCKSLAPEVTEVSQAVVQMTLLLWPQRKIWEKNMKLNDSSNLCFHLNGIPDIIYQNACDSMQNKLLIFISWWTVISKDIQMCERPSLPIWLYW